MFYPLPNRTVFYLPPSFSKQCSKFHSSSTVVVAQHSRVISEGATPREIDRKVSLLRSGQL
jgi:hypothetical protein